MTGLSCGEFLRSGGPWLKRGQGGGGPYVPRHRLVSARERQEDGDRSFRTLARRAGGRFLSGIGIGETLYSGGGEIIKRLKNIENAKMPLRVLSHRQSGSKAEMLSIVGTNKIRSCASLSDPIIFIVLTAIVSSRGARRDRASQPADRIATEK